MHAFKCKLHILGGLFVAHCFSSQSSAESWPFALSELSSAASFIIFKAEKHSFSVLIQAVEKIPELGPVVVGAHWEGFLVGGGLEPKGPCVMLLRSNACMSCARMFCKRDWMERKVVTYCSPADLLMSLWTCSGFGHWAGWKCSEPPEHWFLKTAIPGCSNLSSTPEDICLEQMLTWAGCWDKG